MSRLTKAIVFYLFVTPVHAQSISGKSENFTYSDIRNELAKYPTGLLQAYLDKIVIWDGSGGIALRCSKEIRVSSKLSLRNMRFTLHHEISSVILWQGNQCQDSEVLRKVNKIQNEFLNLNGDFRYDASIEGVNVDKAWIKIEEGTEIGQHFYKFYYSTSTFENDFNTIAEFLFINGEETIDFMTRNIDKPVGKKIQLVLDYYQAVNTLFTKAYFRNQKL